MPAFLISCGNSTRKEDSGTSSHPRAYARGSPAGLDILDNTVVILRNEIHKNAQDKSKIQDMLKIVQNNGFIIPNISEFYGVLHQKDIFLRHNRHWTKFNKF